MSHCLFFSSQAVPCWSSSRAHETLYTEGALRRSLVLRSSTTLHPLSPRTALIGADIPAAGVTFSHPLSLLSYVSYYIIQHHHSRVHSFTYNVSDTNHMTRTHHYHSINNLSFTVSQWEHSNRLKQIRLLLAKEGIETNPGPNLNSLLTLSHVNINSITSPYRLEELNQFVETNHIDILALTETKLDDTIHPALFHLSAFHTPFTQHRNRHGGGTALYARTSLPIRRRKDLELPGEEWIWAQVNIQDTSLIICCIYLPPNITTHRQNEFIDRLTESAAMAQTCSPKSIIILGDINVGNIFINHPTQNSGITPFDIRLKDATDALDLVQLIDEPTRPDSNNLRDLLFVTDTDIITDSGVLSPFSQIDHYPIYAVMNIVKPSTCSRRVKCIWDYDRLDARLLTDTLLHTDWDSILAGDVERAAEKFTSTVLQAAKIAIPMKTIQTEKQHKPWINIDLTRNIRIRNRLFRLAKQRQRTIDWERWKRQRNFVTDLNRRIKAEYIKSKVDSLLQCKQSPFKYHATLKTIIGRTSDQIIPPLVNKDGTITTDDDQKATLLNNHFAEQSELDVDDNRNPITNDNRRLVPSLDSITIAPSEVLNVLNSLDLNKSCGSDELPPKILKLVALLIYEPLTKLYNACLNAGVYPAIWKRANVHPIYKKKGSPSDLTNYRPISLLPCLSKLLGKIIFNHIYKHLTEHSLLTQQQSGYRPGHGTQLQLLHLTGNLYSNLDKGFDFTAIYLDISKYFDKIWHRGLLIKCETEFGIRGTLLQWLESYLKDRQQRVRVGDKFSTFRTINAGCPQGSVLGPLLALIYLNDLANKTTNDVLFFADDTSLYASHKPQNLMRTQQSLQHDLDSIFSYGQNWHITFNATKTVMQTFTTKRSMHSPQLTFGGEPIPRVTNHKHLGLTLSNDLRFHPHVNDIIQKVNRSLSPLYPIAKQLPRTVLAQLYKIYIRPYFDYCDVVYDGHLTLYDSHRLETLQNRAARLVTGAAFRTSTVKLRRDLGWDTLTVRREIHRLQMYFKLKSNLEILPDYMRDTIPHTRQYDTNRTLRNSASQSLPPNHTSLFQRSFIPATTRTWNRLPESIRTCDSPKSFKRELFRRLGVPTPSVYYSLGTKTGNILHSKLRLGMSNLNAHLYSIQKSETPNCACGTSSETTNHFILHCHLHEHCRNRLFRTISSILQSDFSHLPTDTQIDILLHGTHLSTGERSRVAQSFQHFILSSKRFNS